MTDEPQTPAPPSVDDILQRFAAYEMHAAELHASNKVALFAALSDAGIVRSKCALMAMATEAPAGLSIDAVTDVDIREACLLTVEHSDLAHEADKAVFQSAIHAIALAAQREQAAA